MKNRELGRSGIRIAPIVFGGNVFGWTADEARSFSLLDRFLERGFNAIDTADVYSAWGEGLSGGESETVLGSWLARSGRRDDVVLMTKVGMWREREGLSAANIEAAVNDSLRRLRTDYLDVYFAHIDDDKVPLDETLTAFNKLVEAGKVRALGASNYSADRLREALKVSNEQGLARYEVVQPRYNLHDREDFEVNLASLVQEEQLAVVSYFSLASGFLTGKYRKAEDILGTARERMVTDYATERGFGIVAELSAVASELGAKPSQLALAWLLSRPAVTAPIVSATSLAQLDEILEASNLSVPADALQRLDKASQY